jgi:hypothetical protein
MSTFNREGLPDFLHRFVILYHQSPAGEHWDMMLETGSVLTTWSIPPQSLTGLPFTCLAVRLPDHRKHYLDYEGEITGDRGTVSRIDAGTYQQFSPSMFILHGTVFSGRLSVEGEKMTFEPSCAVSRC